MATRAAPSVLVIVILVVIFYVVIEPGPEQFCSQILKPREPLRGAEATIFPDASQSEA